MKNYFLLMVVACLSNVSRGQLRVSPGVQWVNDGAAAIVLHNIDLVNDGTIITGGSITKFAGNTNNSIGGNAPILFNELLVDKTVNSKVSLLQNISVTKRVVFNVGLLDLNQHDLTLDPVAYLFNESENSRITGINGGEVLITLPLNAPVSSNPGNLGAVITSSANMGSVIISRGHRAQSGTGLAGSIQRYFNIVPANNTALNATFRYYYFDAEMNGQAEVLLKMFRSTDAGTNWTNQQYSSRSGIANYVEQTGINAFSRWALSSSGGVLPVTGLEFNAKRISNSKVQLSWKTNQEFNNRGFYIERKKENENNYAATAFINSLAVGGNSSQPLNYAKTDTNDFGGKTYYRLKQEDLDGKFVYSIIRVVAGSDDKTISLKLWPIPSAGDVNVLMTGTAKEILQVFDMNGRLVQQSPVLDNTQQKITRLQPGTYMIRLAGQKELSQKIIIQ